MKGKKGLAVILCILAALFLAGGIVTAAAAQEVSAAAKPKNRFVVKNGVYYYYDSKGKLARGWFISKAGNKYYFNKKTGAAKAGIIKIGNQKYCFNAKGKMLKTWQTVQGKKYFFDQKDGHMHTGWTITAAKNQYYFWEGGVLRPGFRKVGGKTYCFDGKGKMLKKRFVAIGRKTYYLDKNGQKKKGKAKIGKYLYAFNRSTGVMVIAGWYKEKDGSCYYAGEKGRLYTSTWFTRSTGTYYADSNGALATGWLTLSGNKYYLNSAGVRQTGWVEVDNEQYYLNPSTGAIEKNKWIDKNHYVGGNGAWIPGYSNQAFRWPLDSKWSTITSKFGLRKAPGPAASTNHKGIDIAAPSGTPIYAVADGTIVAKLPPSESGGAGNYIQINHGKGIISEYMHQSKFASGIKVGSKVKKGQLIGYVGNTGNSYGAHLHLGFIINGVRRDPLNYVVKPK